MILPVRPLSDWGGAVKRSKSFVSTRDPSWAAHDQANYTVPVYACVWPQRTAVRPTTLSGRECWTLTHSNTTRLLPDVLEPVWSRTNCTRDRTLTADRTVSPRCLTYRPDRSKLHYAVHSSQQRSLSGARWIQSNPHSIFSSDCLQNHSRYPN